MAIDRINSKSLLAIILLSSIEIEKNLVLDLNFF